MMPEKSDCLFQTNEYKLQTGSRTINKAYCPVVAFYDMRGAWLLYF